MKFVLQKKKKHALPHVTELNNRYVIRDRDKSFIKRALSKSAASLNPRRAYTAVKYNKISDGMDWTACIKGKAHLAHETRNIWTHLLDCVAFIGVAAYFLLRPSVEVQVQEEIIFGAFFAGAIICLGFSFAFHTVSCHSVEIGRLFSKLDYCGIALLIMGSFVPWLYYGFYCHYQPKVIYLSVVSVLGCLSIIVSLWDKFSEPILRPLRAGVFMSFVYMRERVHKLPSIKF
uniref:Uncharacterized protein n=1 Tax=Glossina brevipalpis TaxID=37001 RepID=A0A1A9W5Z2_9MUSC